MRNIQTMTGLPFKINEFQDMTDTLPQKPNPNSPRTPDQIEFISVHHSAVEGGTIQGYAKNHVFTRGWPCIGYHMVVKGNQVFQVNDLLTFSYHTASNNANTVSVSISADLSKRTMSEDERNNLYAVILTYMSLFNIPVENVKGHKEFPIPEPTACPCIDMDKVRSDIHSIQLNMALKAAQPSREKRVANAYALAMRTKDLYNKAKDPEEQYSDVALEKMDKIYSFCERENLLNP